VPRCTAPKSASLSAAAVFRVSTPWRSLPVPWGCFTNLDGQTIDGLPDGVRTGLAVRPLRVVTVLRQSDADLKYEVFRRLNESAVPLNPQEIRNVLFRGPLNELLIELSESPFLRAQLKITPASERYKQMTDVEMVLRFLTLRREWSAFQGDYRNAMDEFMKDHRSATNQEIDAFRTAFDDAIARCEQLWGEYAFRRPEGTGWRDQPLAGLYDAQMLGASAVTNGEINVLAQKADEVVSATRTLFGDPAFDEAVRQATNTPNRVRLRVERMTKMLEETAE
jgi:hypothetical protein